LSIQIIAEARQRVLAGWCQGAVARDANGRTVPFSSPEARRWSTLGALLASRDGQPPSDLVDAVSSLHRSTGESALEVWNDRTGRTQKEVVAAFDRALEGGLARGEPERPSSADDLSTYWLSTCEGFSVESDDGRVGIVEEVRLSRERQPEALAVRTGLFRTRLVIVPIDDVHQVVPQHKRVLLRPPLS
jgi:hypothetical protein